MQMLEIFDTRAFRLSLAFLLAIALSTAAAFAFIYWQVYSGDTQVAGAILVDEAAKSQGDSPDQLRRALESRLTRDIHRLDVVALFDPNGALVFGNVAGLPAIPIDGRAHVVQEQALPDSSGNREPAIFVARRIASGGTLLLGRSLWVTYGLQGTLLRAMAIALVPTILLKLAIGVMFARSEARRYQRFHETIARIMQGDLEARLSVSNDNRDIDRAARAFNQMLDEIERLLERLKGAGDNIAHDLRTPLAVARARIERALNNDVGVKELHAAMEAALAQIDKVSVAVSAILRISAVENDARKLQLRDFDLGAICVQVFDFYEPCAESKGVTIVVEAAKPVLMRGDQDLMREALSNLVDNAIKFTPVGGAVRIEVRTLDGRPFVRVSDTGIGVPPQEHTRIFDRFYRGERSGKAPGHGLGLSIAERIANVHGLKLTVEDNNPGARFELRAPAPARLARDQAA
jgi:signal transduction histidine kinase